MVSRAPFRPEIVMLRESPRRQRVPRATQVLAPTGLRGIPAPQLAPNPLPIDVYATANDVIVQAAMPGINPDDLEITYDGTNVTLAGRMPAPLPTRDAEPATWYAQELWHGPFQRSIALPIPIDAAGAEARFMNGLLRLVLPKADSARVKRIPVRVVGEQPATIAATSEPEQDQSEETVRT